jgi:hypothetical protein
MDNFKNHPESLGEIRANRENSSAPWTPRDALIQVLRMIDSGEVKPDVLVVAWGETVNDMRDGHFRVSSPDPLVSLGLMQATIFKMQD